MSVDLLQAGRGNLDALIFAFGIGSLLALSVALMLWCGVLSLAAAAFMGTGAYGAALLSLHSELPFVAVLAVAVLASALLAVLLGAVLLRLPALPLAVATLGLGELLRALTEAPGWVAGGPGLTGIPERTAVWQVLLALIAVLVLLHRLRRSRFGRACAAGREDRRAATASGIDVAQLRLWAFVLSAAIAALAGALEAHHRLGIAPGSYGFETMLEGLAMTLLGGTASLAGPLLGAAALGLPCVLWPALAPWNTALDGTVLVLVMLFLPQGLLDPAPWRRRG